MVCAASPEVSPPSKNSLSDPRSFLQSSREKRRFVRHEAGLAGHVQRMAHEDTRNAMLSANFTQAPQVVAAVCAEECNKRLGSKAKLVRKGETDPLAAIIKSKDPTWRVAASFRHTNVPRPRSKSHIAFIIREA